MAYEPFYQHAFYAPYRLGERVLAPEEFGNKHGSITRVKPDDALNGEDATYWVTFDGEEQECPEAFSFWRLVPEDK